VGGSVKECGALRVQCVIFGDVAESGPLFGQGCGVPGCKVNGLTLLYS